MAPSTPSVSVVMAVHNERPYLEDAVQSILDQTFEDFEFIIVNDGSTDGSKEVLERFGGRDDRIRLIHQQNRGLIASLNRGLDKAQGSYIARMDGDDISHPERFERQVQFLHTHPEIGGVGTKVEYIDADGQVTGTWPLPTDPDLIAWTLLFNTCLCHPAVTIRRALLERVGGYAEWARLAEDYELWTRATQEALLTNLPDALFQLRRHEGAVTVAKRTEQIRMCERVALEYHRALLGEDAEEQMARFCVWMETDGIDRAIEETGIQDFPGIHRYLRRLYEAFARRLGPERSTIRVRQRSLPMLDAIADRIAEHEGWRQGVRHKIRARCMAPRHEILPWGVQALRRRIF